MRCILLTNEVINWYNFISNLKTALFPYRQSFSFFYYSGTLIYIPCYNTAIDKENKADCRSEGGHPRVLFTSCPLV